MKSKKGLVVFILPFFIILATRAILLQSPQEALSKIITNPISTLLEYSILLGICLFLYGLCGRLSLSYVLCAAGSTVLTLISYFKEEINGAPLVLGDFAMADGIFDIAAFALPSLHFSAVTVFSIAIQIIIFVLLLFFEKKQWKIRPLPLIAGVLFFVFFATPPGFSATTNVYKTLSPEETTQEEKIHEHGLVSGLYFSYAGTKVKNFNPSPKEIEALRLYAEEALSHRTEKENVKTPNVIFIMSEAFFDPTTLPDVTFSTDPCPNFHRLSESSTSGSFVSTTYSGGTGYVEAELLTGICSHYLKGSGTITSLEDSAYKKMPVITDVFKNYGYTTTFLHSYNSTLYNRQAMYEGFGFDSILFEDSFPENTMKYNNFISDKDFTDKIISLLENKGSSPLFMFAVSMENHYPYVSWKYPEKTVEVTSDKLNEEETVILESLAGGIYNADKALGSLVDYLEKSEEDYMLVFFGDHLPNLSTEQGSVYTSLGVSTSNNTTDWAPDELCRMLSTNYLVWTNYEEEAEYPDRTEGCTFMGLNILKRLGFTLTDYFQYLDYHIESKVTLYRPRLFLDRELRASSAIPEDTEEIMSSWKNAVRDIIYAGNEVFGE